MKRVREMVAEWVARSGEWLAENSASWAVNGAGMASIASIAYGAGLIYRPAGFITGGVIVLAMVLMIVRSGGK